MAPDRAPLAQLPPRILVRMKHSQATPETPASDVSETPSAAGSEAAAAQGSSSQTRSKSSLRTGVAALAVAVTPLAAVADDADSSSSSTPDVAAGIGIANNLLYRAPGGDPKNKDRLDVYRPTGASAENKLPVILFIHGGGLFQGDKNLYAGLGQFLASEGYVAVVPNHRLSPDVSHPTHIEDIAAAFAWTHENIAEYGGDPDRIVVTGHSAGGYLAALLALDPRYLAAHSLTTDTIKGVVPISGFYHVERLAEERPKSVWGTDRNVWLEASPARYVRADAPPMLLLFAENDTPERRQESRDLVEELHSKGDMQVEAQQIDDRNHVSIIRRFGSDDDRTAALLLEFSAKLLKKE